MVTGVTSADEKQRTWRIPAKQLEEPIAQAVQDKLNALRARINDQALFGNEVENIETPKLFEGVERATINQGTLSVKLNPTAITDLLGQPIPENTPDLTLTIPFTERRRGAEMKLVTQGPNSVDQTLLRNIAKADHWYARIKQGATFDDVAAEAGTSKRRIQQMIHLAFLAPDIIRDVTQGTHPLGLTSDWLLRHDLPLDWNAQRKRIAALK